MHRQRKHKTLPPHSWETHSLANAGEANRILIIGVISIAAIIVLVILLFVAQQFVGKAFTGIQGTAGSQDVTVTPGGSPIVTVEANTAGQTTAIAFQLQLPAGISCSDITTYESLLPWSAEYLVEDTRTCADNILFFEYATLNWQEAVGGDGDFEIAKITFNPLSEGVYNLDYASFDIISLNEPNIDLITQEGIFKITVAEAPALPPTPETPTITPSGGGGGGGCFSRWSCPATWSYCSADLEQSRTCTDLRNCDRRKPTKTEVRSCAACEESWVCSAWSSCQNRQQSRSCLDEHSCGTSVQKPELQKACQAAEPAPLPARVTEQPIAPKAVQQPAAPTVSAWKQLGNFITQKKGIVGGTAGAIVAIALLTIVALHYFRPKKLQYNFSDLKEWVRKEKSMGTSDDDVRSILKQHTGWKEEEIGKAFKELGSEK